MQQLPEPFFAKCISTNGQVVLKLGGECDLATLQQLNDALRDVIALQPKDVLVDLAQVTFVDSMTLGALTAAGKQIRASGGSFRITRAAAEVRRSFEITGLDSYLLIPGRK